MVWWGHPTKPLYLKIIKMDLEKTRAIVEDLLALCEKHGVTIMTGFQKDEQLNYQYDGLNIFITDGSPSKKKVLDKAIGEAMQYQSTLRLTLTKNKFKHEN